MVATKSGDFDNFRPKHNMRQSKTATHQSAVTKQLTYLLRGGVGGHIEIFRFHTQKKVADTATHQIGVITSLIQAVEHLEGIFTDIFARNSVLVTRNDRDVRESFTLLDHDIIAVKHLAAKISDSGKNSPPR